MIPSTTPASIILCRISAFSPPVNSVPFGMRTPPRPPGFSLCTASWSQAKFAARLVGAPNGHASRSTSS